MIVDLSVSMWNLDLGFLNQTAIPVLVLSTTIFTSVILVTTRRRVTDEERNDKAGTRSLLLFVCKLGLSFFPL